MANWNEARQGLAKFRPGVSVLNFRDDIDGIHRHHQMLRSSSDPPVDEEPGCAIVDSCHRLYVDDGKGPEIAAPTPATAWAWLRMFRGFEARQLRRAVQ
jgi:hypothetical protein